MQPQLDDLTVKSFLPPTRRILRHVAALVALSAVGGPLIGFFVFGEVRGETLALSLRTGLGWALSFAFVAVFIYTAWLVRSVWQAYHKHVAALKMAEFYRAVEGEAED